ncbi:MAG: LamB/YcsF family protein [Deltaproteobacteria bacterium]|jgi:5-oxoprolinase (ATP-hydrolysing) subunit A|nr:LamB/YcsF family protein [Deltaproteobacteria bacterium]MBT4643533.1 LamB/YcsF family protein [Deltaproteobacteria bacterium]MBT6500905.1 LamB/YcsF family protein [Deltaproteobacteria bacterium]MBT6616479.1 LamB/YcsF family protein [Deltaproteobacteria bacterium]MBT7154025.1 LamB/YcsF family protein [Deltaproteobacteria bacterium]
MLTLNCDIGERGPDHPVDSELMRYIQVANLACGGHAGDESSVKAFRALAVQHGVDISAHLSYPDRENFGRTTMDIPVTELFDSLNEQIALLPDITLVKFHGALYNDAVVNTDLAASLAGWLVAKKMKSVITFPDSELAKECANYGLSVINEVFAERRYAYDTEKEQLTLVKRSKPYASITEVEEAVEHAREMIQTGNVSAVISDAGDTTVTQKVSIKADTVCIHSDSTIALELVKALAGFLNDKHPI